MNFKEYSTEINEYTNNPTNIQVSTTNAINNYQVYGETVENLFDISEYTIGTTTFPTKTLMLEPNTAYTMSSDAPRYNGGALIFLSAVGESATTANSGVYNGHPITKTTDANGNIYVGLRDNGSGYDLSTYKTMLVKGSTVPTRYAPYDTPDGVGEASQLGIQLDEPLRGLGDIKDTLDLSTGVLTRRIGVAVLDGTGGQIPDGNTTRYFFKTIASTITVTSTNNQLCSHYSYAIIATANENIGFRVTSTSYGNTRIAIRSPNTNLDTTEKYRAFYASEYANGRPVTAYYVLANPVTEQVDVPSGLAGIIEGYLTQTGTPTESNPIYPEANGVKLPNGKYEVYADVYKIPILNTSGVTENLWDLDSSWTNSQTDNRDFFNAGLMCLNGSTVVAYKYLQINANGQYSITITSADTNYNRILFKHSGATKDLIIGGINGDFSSQDSYTISFSVLGYTPSIAEGIKVENIMLVKGSTAPNHYIPYKYVSNYNLYIGNNKLYKDEYIDYETQKVYKLKEVHKDTVTIDGVEWDILDYDHDEVYDNQGNLAQHSVTIQTHDCITNLQFDAKEALFAFPNGLSAGTYYFTVSEQPWYTGDVGKVITFTITNNIPATGQLLVRNGYNETMINANISSFASPSSSVIIETVTMTEASSSPTGTNLGTVSNAINGNINSIQRALLGSNNWKNSAIRQYLNSDAVAGSVWEPKTIWDKPPSWSTSQAGFLNGFSSNFKNTIGTTKKTTALNTVTDGGGTETTSEKVFLLSYTETYCGGSEGAAYDYYKNYSNLPAAGSGADENRIKYLNGAAKYWWLRSPNPSYASNVRSIYPSGALNNYYANNTIGVVPTVCIPLDNIDNDSYLQSLFLKPIDPPVQFPIIDTYIDKNEISINTSIKPNKLVLDYLGWRPIPITKYNTDIDTYTNYPINIHTSGEDIDNYNIYGKSIPNLFNINSTWYKQNPNDIIDISGNEVTITANLYDYVKIDVEANTDYTISFDYQNITGTMHRVTIVAADGTTIIDRFDGTSGTFNTGSNTTVSVLFYAGDGSQGKTKYSNVVLIKGNNIAPYYIPYETPAGVGEETENLFDKDAKDTSNGYIANKRIASATGLTYDNPNCFISEYISVLPSTTYTLDGYSTGVPSGVASPECCYYDSSKTFITGSQFRTANNFQIQTPNNAAYIRLNISYDTASTAMMIKGISPTSFNYIPYGYKIPITYPNIVTANMFNKDAKNINNGYVDGYHLKVDGTISANSSWAISEYIPITQTSTNYTFSYGYSSSSPAICFYDSNKQYIQGNPYGGQNPKTVTIPQNISYIRFSYIKSYNNGIMFVKGNSLPEQYVSYIYTLNAYIGNNKLMNDEYIDYEEQKIYKRTINLIKGTEIGTIWANSSSVPADMRGKDADANNRTRTNSGEYYKFSTTQSYTISTPEITGTQVSVYTYDPDDYTSLADSAWTNLPYTFTPSNYNYRFVIRYSDNRTITNANYPNLIISEGSTEPTSYVPYLQPIDPPISFPTLTTYIGENIIDINTTIKPNKVELEYLGWREIGVETYTSGEWVEDND